MFVSASLCCLNVLLPQLFQKNGYDLKAYNNVRDILSNTNVITNIVKLIVHSPVGEISINNNYIFVVVVFV